MNFKLFVGISPRNEVVRMEMSRVPYALMVESLMYSMICTRPDTTQIVGVVSRFMAYPGKYPLNLLNEF